MKNSLPPMRRISVALALLLASSGLHAQETKAAPTGLTSEFVYKYLVGEVAGQRGDPALAGTIFYDLAKSTHDPRLAERAARAAAIAKQPALALRAATLWAEADPKSVEAQQAMAQLLLSGGDLKAAKPYLEKLLTSEENRGNGFLYLNSVLTHHPDKEAALALIQSLAQPYPKQPEARIAIAHLAFTAGKNELAIKELDTAEALRPGWEPIAALHGEILLREAPEKAMGYFRDYLAKHPAANDIRLSYAKLLVNQKKIAEARTEFTKLADAVKDNAEMAVVVGLLAGQLGDYAQADQYFRRALDHDYKDPDQLYLYLGQSAEKQHQNAQAYEWYKRVEGDELRFDAQLRIAALMAGENKLAEARDYLHKLPDLNADQQGAALQLEASLLSQNKQYTEAYDVLQRAINTTPNSPEMIYDFAMLAERVGKTDVMEKELRKLIQIKPDFAQAYNALGYSLADRNVRLDEASNLIAKALELSPGDHYILDSMGWVQYRRGQLDQAVDYLRRAYADEADPEIAAHLGEVLWKQGKQDEAAKTWDEALHQHPDNEILQNTSKKFRP